MQNHLQEFAQLLKDAKNPVFFGGAGVSTESGIKDFRSKDGLYNQKYDYPPEEILSHTFFLNKTEEFYRFYKDKIINATINAKPNPAHVYMAKHHIPVITQNIDGLHSVALSGTITFDTQTTNFFDPVKDAIYELHGSIHRNNCQKCGEFYDLSQLQKLLDRASNLVPICLKCSNGVVKPDVVLYEEGLDDHIVSESVKLIKSADLLIIGGTSLTVYPAASLIHYFSGQNLVLINRDETNADSSAQIVIREPIGEVFSNVEKLLNE